VVSNLVSIVLLLWLYETFIILLISNETYYSIGFRCFLVDGCDWIYIRDVINRFTKINYIRMFNYSQSLLNFISKTILLIVIRVYVH
jgi:hypothetical protein